MTLTAEETSTRPARTARINPLLGILSISAAAEDHRALRQSASRIPCWIRTEDTCRTALWRLSQERISIVVCERDLPDGTWRDILENLDASPERPYLIVTSRLADDLLWAEVLNLGGYDVLAKPFNAKETRHVLETAYLSRCGAGQPWPPAVFESSSAHD